MKKDIALILKSVREYKIYAIFTPIFMIVESAIECLMPLFMSRLLGVVDEGNTIALANGISLAEAIDTNKLILFICLMVGGAILSLAAGILGGIFAARASTGMAKNLRMDLYKKVQSFSFSNIDKFSASSLVTRMTTDISTVQMAFQMTIRMVVRAPLMMIFSVIFAFVAGGQMAWIFIGLIPVIALGFIIIMILAMPTFRRVFKRYDAMNESVEENVSGIRVVKSYVREEYEKEKFKTASDNIAKEFIKAERIVVWTNPILNFAIHASNVLICAIGSYLIIGAIGQDNSPLTIPQLSALQTYGVQILMSLMFVSMIFVMLIMALEAIKRISEVLKEEPTILNPENPIMEVSDGSINFDHVSFKYSLEAEKNALEGLNITIKSGEFVGIIGSTGSGKTSLVNLISRLYDVSEGNVIVGGHNVKDYDLITLRDAVSVVLQKNVLFSGTIADNLRWGNLHATDEEILKAAKTAQADEFVQTFPKKYDTYIEQGGSNVSGGQKQRLCIARALLKQPKILVLDDSTSAVDTKTDKLIRESLRKDIPNTTKIVIAQRISSIEDADKIIVMENGKINQIGTHAELLKSNKIYQEVYNTQVRKGGN